MPIELMLKIQINFDTTPKNNIHALVIRYWKTDMHLHFSRKHGQWALLLDRKRLILFKKDCTYDLHPAGTHWLQRNV